MAKPKPTDLFAGFELLESTDTPTATSIAIPVATLTGLTEAEADPITGDGRELALALLTTLHETYATLPTPSTRMQVARGEAVTGDTTRRLDFTVSLSVEIPTSAYVVQAEPSN